MGRWRSWSNWASGWQGLFKQSFKTSSCHLEPQKHWQMKEMRKSHHGLTDGMATTVVATIWSSSFMFPKQQASSWVLWWESTSTSRLPHPQLHQIPTRVGIRRGMSASIAILAPSTVSVPRASPCPDQTVRSEASTAFAMPTAPWSSAMLITPPQHSFKMFASSKTKQVLVPLARLQSLTNRHLVLLVVLLTPQDTYLLSRCWGSQQVGSYPSITILWGRGRAMRWQGPKCLWSSSTASTSWTRVWTTSWLASWLAQWKESPFWTHRRRLLW